MPTKKKNSTINPSRCCDATRLSLPRRVASFCPATLFQPTHPQSHRLSNHSPSLPTPFPRLPGPTSHPPTRNHTPNQPKPHRQVHHQVHPDTATAKPFPQRKTHPYTPKNITRQPTVLRGWCAPTATQASVLDVTT